MSKPKKKGEPSSTIVQNRRAKYDYEFHETFEAGLSLKGTEVKVLRNGGGGSSLADGWISIENGEAYLKNAFVPRLKHGAFNHEPTRVRKLLLHKREIEKLERALTQKGMTAVPTKMYWKRGRAKLQVVLGKGKTKGDKRQAIKARDQAREAQQAIAAGRRGYD